MKQRILFVLSLCIFLLAAGWHTAIAVGSTTPTPTVTTAPKAQIQYDLPYPGVLPDHPLYMLKRFRDFILEHIIAEPMKKAEFYILQADKRLEMGVYLVDASKFALAETTVSKGENYMDMAIAGLAAYKTTGNAVPAYILDHLNLALSKHEEVITGLITKSPEIQKAGFTGTLNHIKSLQTKADALK